MNMGDLARYEMNLSQLEVLVEEWIEVSLSKVRGPNEAGYNIKGGKNGSCRLSVLSGGHGMRVLNKQVAYQ